ncbi:hypothetical protein [Thalassotalea profundi]|uniref:Uncharacterized protein n=1 Tax=Thalassotalea profundi TaxID=2036687 RepID=A0ABQ3IFT0_9GAMM|nr:hypothetical protein [Thalassotalea profundi]GHE77160.1 hypothetical protein GCM10011501_00740 [Thalassotalea profundi]
MGYQEKASWGTLLITLIVLVNYVGELITVNITDISILRLLSISFIWIIAASIIVHVILAILNAKEAEKGTDERDNIFELTATRNSGWTLYVFVFFTFSQLFLVQHFITNGEISFLIIPNVSTAYNMANVLMLGLLISSIIHEVTKLYYYRRGY